MDSGSWELRDDVLNIELCVILIVAVSVTAHALFAWKVCFTKQGGCLWYLGKDIVPGPGYGGYIRS